MSLYRILTLARRVIQQLLADRRTIALILIVPLVVITVAGILVGAQSTSINVGIVQQDQGTEVPVLGNLNLGERLVDTLDSMSGQLRVTVLDADNAQAALQRGDLDAVISLPADFTVQSTQTRSVTLSVEFEGSNPIAAQALEGLLTGGMIRTLASLSVLGAQATSPSLEIDATYLYGGANFGTLDYIAPVFIGLFVFLFVFILTCVAFLRERSAGTLERLQATPITRIEIVLGYMIGFALFALIQAVIILVYTIFALGVHYAGSLIVVFVVELLLALMAVNLGIFFSTFARNEFQVVQFIPLVVVTQILLSGAFWAIKAMPQWLQPLAWLMPLTYANEALRNVMIKGFDLIGVGLDVLALIIFAIGFIILAAQTMHRQI